MKNSIDKMAEQFTSVEELQAYCDSQYKTILSLNKRISDQEAELNKLREEKVKAAVSQTIEAAGNDQFKVTDEETICVVQLALLKAHSMERELITDEVKRVEVLVKTLLAIRGRDTKKAEKDTSNMSTEELLKHFDNAAKEPQ